MGFKIVSFLENIERVGSTEKVDNLSFSSLLPSPFLSKKETK